MALHRIKGVARRSLGTWMTRFDRHLSFRKCILALSCVLVLLTAAARAQSIESLPQLTSGTEVPVGELEAVGTEPGCTATLVGPLTVLTAAHCVCSGQTSPTGCVTRTSFTLKNVQPLHNPSIPTVDESVVRRDILLQRGARSSAQETTDTRCHSSARPFLPWDQQG